MGGTTEDVIDYATKKRESSTQPTEARKKRKVRSDGGANVQDGEEENDSPNKTDSSDEYEAMVEHAKAQNKNNPIDLKDVNTLLNEAPDASETSDDKSDEKAEEKSGERKPQFVPSGPVISAIPPGQNIGSSLSQKRAGKAPKLSPTLVNDASVFPLLNNAENESHHTGDTTEDADGSEMTEEDIGGSSKVEESSIPDDWVYVPDASTINESIVTDDIKPAHVLEDKQSTITNDSSKRSIPASILEKGIIYFCYRHRVGLEGAPQGIEDIARSYFVLRPLPLEAKIPKGPLKDDSNACLLSLPKKVWPKSEQDKFLCFVDGVGMTIQELKNRFSGPSQLPPIRPIAEGVYAIVSSGRESHLAYHITYPEISQIQKDLGIKAKGSFVCSIKNPNAPSRENVKTDHVAKYSEELQKKFRDLRWMSLVPEHLTYEGTQMLLIGEGESKVKNDENNNPEEEMNKLEQEDQNRVEALKEDDPIFADLGLGAKEFSQTQTTW
ncbi:hypothetical protein OCU04_007925 [Sclerotinia nivalis]|uniref:Uncharacterized protein n=1 Tax=Sclerotinia nivalis TaxID=352851 RepID=A0A9X0AJZ9_9HELO|nr:hypothetical protein OCU04_007925 [Sclerotinia nivalis]